jgi:hypothetical protein
VGPDDFRFEGCKLLVFDVKVKEGSRAFMHSNSKASYGQEKHLPDVQPEALLGTWHFV